VGRKARSSAWYLASAFPSKPDSRLGCKANPIVQGRLEMDAIVVGIDVSDAIVVGIDVSKDKLDIAVLPQGQTFATSRDRRSRRHSSRVPRNRFRWKTTGSTPSSRLGACVPSPTPRQRSTRCVPCSSQVVACCSSNMDWHPPRAQMAESLDTGMEVRQRRLPFERADRKYDRSRRLDRLETIDVFLRRQCQADSSRLFDRFSAKLLSKLLLQDSVP
jgi:hypothetical protein